MTRERKMAVSQWERVVKRLKKGKSFLKRYPKDVTWQKNCWLCQYVRRPPALGRGQGCNRCPIYIYERRLHHVSTDCCGCSGDNTLYIRASDYDEVEAAEQILRFIKYGYREIEGACRKALEHSGEGEQVR